MNAADGVIHTAFGHHGDYSEAIKDDCVVIRAMTDAMSGPQAKPFIMSSATGFLGNTGPTPVNEEYPIDLDFPLAARSKPERVCCHTPLSARKESHHLSGKRISSLYAMHVHCASP